MARFFLLLGVLTVPAICEISHGECDATKCESEDRDPTSEQFCKSAPEEMECLHHITRGSCQFIDKTVASTAWNSLNDIYKKCDLGAATQVSCSPTLSLGLALVTYILTSPR